MTSPTRKHSTLNRIGRGAALALMTASLAMASGCAKKKKPAPPPPPPPKPKVVVPDPVDVKGVMAQLKTDARVEFPSSVLAPADRTLAEGIVKLADALAKGDSGAIKPMLDKNAQSVLDELVGSGGWSEGTKPIEQVRIVSVSGTGEAHADSSQVGMAIQSRDGAYLLAWSGKRDGDNWTFAAA